MRSARRAALAGAAALGVLTAALSGCAGSSASSSGPAGPTVVTSTTQTEDFARHVLGDRGEVVGLLKPNQSPHHHETTPSDLAKIGKADVVVHGGAGSVDSWLPSAVQAAGFSGEQTDAAAGAHLRTRVKDGKVEDDPHIWHNPENAKTMVRNISASVQRQDPEHKQEYERNTQEYLGQLDGLEAEVRSAVDAIPPQQRKLVTTHGAFGYFSDHYGVEFVGSVIPSFDDQAEQSSKQIDEFVATLQRSGAKAIFTEANIPPDVVRAVGDEAGVKIVTDPLHSDNNAPGLDYIATEKHNARVITSNMR